MAKSTLVFRPVLLFFYCTAPSMTDSKGLVYRLCMNFRLIFLVVSVKSAEMSSICSLSLSRRAPVVLIPGVGLDVDAGSGKFIELFMPYFDG